MFRLFRNWRAERAEKQLGEALLERDYWRRKAGSDPTGFSHNGAPKEDSAPRLRQRIAALEADLEAQRAEWQKTQATLVEASHDAQRNNQLRALLQSLAACHAELLLITSRPMIKVYMKRLNGATDPYLEGLIDHG